MLATPLSDAMPMPPGGLFRAGVHYYPVRVYFEDTDAGGIVYHASYLRFMERARSDMLRVAGIDQRGNLERGTGVYAVADLAIKYRRPARLDDDLIVKSSVSAVGAATCSIAQTILRDTEIMTDATVTAAFISPEGRPKRQPADWIAIFNSIAGGKDPTP